jgi:hypothetical protein
VYSMPLSVGLPACLIIEFGWHYTSLAASSMLCGAQ